jgi:DNA repair photolyase
MSDLPSARFIGRGSNLAPANRFETTRHEADFEQLAADDDLLAGERRLPTVFLPDNAATIIRENDSPDIPFRYSINPYRGCEHGCAYCYARPTHETLGMNAGIDFESKVLVKHDAAALLRKELNRKRWQCEPIMISGVTDCYQPAEREYKLTRGILEVMLEAHQPVCLITKNALVLRDLDLIAAMAEKNLIGLALSVTTLDADLARTLEPRTATPQARLRAIRELSAAGVPVRAMIAPVIPGLTDNEVPALMAAVKEAGARGVGYTMLRLPLAVAPIFQAWLREHRPQAERIESLIRDMRSGKLNDAQFGSRMRGRGAYADGIAQTFEVFAKKLGLDTPWEELDCSQFRPPELVRGQRRLFT